MMDLEECTLVDAGDEIMKCIKHFRDLSHTIHELEESIDDIEHNEKVLSQALSDIRNDGALASALITLIANFRKTHAIDETRTRLEQQYAKKEAVSSAIKLAVHITSDEPQAQYICPICFERPVGRFISVCGHTFCTRCIDAHHRSTCPMCRTSYDITHVRNLIYSS